MREDSLEESYTRWRRNIKHANNSI